MVAELRSGSGLAALSGFWQGFVNQRGVAWMARRGCYQGGWSGRLQLASAPANAAVPEDTCKRTVCCAFTRHSPFAFRLGTHLEVLLRKSCREARAEMLDRVFFPCLLFALGAGLKLLLWHSLCCSVH